MPWPAIARMRDHLTHRYFDTQLEIVSDVITNDLTSLRDAVAKLARTHDQQTSLGLDESDA